MFRILSPFSLLLIVVNVFLTANLFTACDRPARVPARLLVFTKTEGFRHASIPAGVAALRKICADQGWQMDSTEDAAAFTEENLRQYAAVVFLNTTGDVLNPDQESDFERYIQAGGGFVGVHSATDTEYGWHWYGGLVGAYFNGHPEIQDATLHVRDHEHASTKHLGATWQRRDEWYNLRDVNPNVRVLLHLDETTYQGGTMGSEHPAAWYHEYDGGRAFYTAGGHTDESYAEPEFLQHLAGGIRYAMGKRAHDYGAVRTERRPDATRFVKTVLASELTEPMELDRLPDGRILLIERRGALKMFEPETGMLSIAYKLPVHSEHEDGLLGLAVDPNYAQNHWIYLYYSPVKESVNRLSRFVFANNTLNIASEQKILDVPVQRQECCHTGGSIEFDDDGFLYLSTGDNTNPFNSDGYAPIDQLPGRSAWDALRSSGNTMDLRGKILRIRPLAEGGYVCPKGNLFTDKDIHVLADSPSTYGRQTASSTSATGGHHVTLPSGEGRGGAGAPEIYVMGCRNPFRISLDSRRKLLFWGEVGPDSGEPDTARGPAGHDEVNRARAAGFFGWPLFVGDNKPYRRYDFRTKKSGAAFDPAQPLNESPNNTGSRTLPAAQPAFIWYPYDDSPEFPLVGKGGRNAMAGPVYYTDRYPAATRLPDYYDGKLITYDWMRGWMMAITIDSLGNFSRMEPFADSVQLSRPMDMIVDPTTGSIWLLEYGTQWFSSNPDARLSRIDYVRGNRPPQASLQASVEAGGSPLSVVFSTGRSRDYDNDRLAYTLNFGDGSEPVQFEATPRRVLRAGIDQKKSTSDQTPNPDSIAHTYQAAGTYEAVLTIVDPAGKRSVARRTIRVGNEPPVVHWDFLGRNRSFYRPGDTVAYRVRVEDAEDGSLERGSIAPKVVATSVDYLETGFDITQIAQGHQQAREQAEYSRGKVLIDKSDCKTCHALDRAVNGPSFQAIAERYRGNEFAVRNLSLKVRKGGAGNWGQTVMSAHPQISEEDAGEMVRWILSLGGPPRAKQTLAVNGTYTFVVPPPKKGEKPNPGAFIWYAAYRDQGSANQDALERAETLLLRPTFMQAEKADSMSKGVAPFSLPKSDTVFLRDLKNRSFFVVRHVDLTDVHTVVVGLGTGNARYPAGGGRLELRLDGPGGQLLASQTLEAYKPAEKMRFYEVNLPIRTPADTQQFYDLYFVFRNDANPSRNITVVDWLRFDLKR